MSKPKEPKDPLAQWLAFEDPKRKRGKAKSKAKELSNSLFGVEATSYPLYQAESSPVLTIERVQEAIELARNRGYDYQRLEAYQAEINRLYSQIIENQAAFGVQNITVPPNGLTETEGRLTVLRVDAGPAQGNDKSKGDDE